MDTMNNMPIYSVQPSSPQVVIAPQFTPAGTLISTLTIASAVSIGSNMLDVQNGSMTIPQALLNGVAKGTAATLVLNATARSTVLQVIIAAGTLAGAGYLIDSSMKKNKQELCRIEESPAR
jgi:uncharacterized membrane protein YebE (DUF533 family)